MSHAASSHRVKVERIAAEVRDRADRGQAVRIAKGGVSHFVPLPGDPRLGNPPIDVSDLVDPVGELGPGGGVPEG